MYNLVPGHPQHQRSNRPHSECGIRVIFSESVINQNEIKPKGLHQYKLDGQSATVQCPRSAGLEVFLFEENYTNNVSTTSSHF